MSKTMAYNPLISIIIFLVILILALITTSIVLRIDKNPIIQQKALESFAKAPESVTSSTIKSKNITVSTSNQKVMIVTSRPIILTEKPRNVCETPECITVAHQLHNWNDPSVDPCEDFYKFSCGKYIEHTVVEGSRTKKKGYIVDQLIKEHLIANKPTDVKSEKLMKTLHKKCEEIQDDRDKLDENTKQSIKDILEDINSIGLWPLLDENWDEKKFNLNDMLANLAKLGVQTNGLFVVGNPNFQALEFAPINNRQEPEEDLKETIEMILNENGIDFDEETLDEDFAEYMELDKGLLKHSFDPDAEEVKLPELQKAVPSIDFGRIIESFSNRKNVPEKVKETAFGRRVSLFFDKKTGLENLIQNTPKRSLANYLIFYYIDIYLDSLSSNDEIDRNCAEITTQTLPEAALAVFMEHHFDRENIQKVSDLVDEIKEDFIGMIQDSTWLHEDTKKNAIEKIQKMKKMIGYPEELEDSKALEKLHEDLNIEPTDSFYKMYSKINKFRIELIMDYASSESSYDPKHDLLMANALYTHKVNKLSFFVPYIDDPFFDTTFPKYAKIAITGSIVAHEIGHGFDPNGISYDENGNLKDWWTKEDLKEYEKRTQCLVEQYNNYDDPDFGKNLDGTKTILEMAADGLKMKPAWRAFKKLDLSEEPKFVGLENESIEKVFFRIYALNYCAARNMNDLDTVLEKHHPTYSFRVNGVLSNMKEFAETFNCPLGSPMNPKKKCELF